MSDRHEQLKRKALRRGTAFLSLCTGIVFISACLLFFVFGQGGIAIPLFLVAALNISLISVYLKQTKYSEHSAHLRQTR